MGVLLFLHLAGLVVWAGGILSTAVLLLVMKQIVLAEGTSMVLRKITKFFNTLTHPAGFLVLVTGGIMLSKTGIPHSKEPFWLAFMEQFGGIVILLSLIFITVLGRRAVKQVVNQDAAAGTKSLNAYISSLFVSFVLILSVLFVVTVKL